MSKSQVGSGVVVVAGAAAIIFLQYQTGQKLRAENESLRQQIASLKSDNSDTPTPNSQSATGDDRNELLRLRGEVSALRSQTNQVARLQQQNQQLQDTLAAVKQARQQSAAQAEEQHALMIRQVNNAKQAVLGMVLYANDHGDQFPTNFDLTTPYYGNPDFATNLNQFEIVFRGAMSKLANPAATIAVRSIQPSMVNGKWTKVYGFADGHVESHSDADGNFEEWEQQHVPVFKNQ